MREGVVVPGREGYFEMDLDYTNFFTHIELIIQHKRATTISKESTSQAFGDGSGGHPTS